MGAAAGASERPAAVALRAGPVENARFVLTQVLPAFAKGIGELRAPVVSAAVRLRQTDWAAATLRALRSRYGGAPVLVRALSGDVLLLLDPADVRQFFAEPVERLALDAHDKVRALGVLEPNGVICSHGPLREARRAVNDRALAAGRTVHPSCAPYLAVVDEECAPLTAGPRLDQATVQRAVERIGRRIVLGDRAAGDEELHRRLRRLREEANWLGLRKSRNRANERLYAATAARLAEYAADAPAHTLLGRALAEPSAPEVDPVGQVPHWFFALDGVGTTVAQTLLLLAAHPAEQDAVRDEVRDAGREAGRDAAPDEGGGAGPGTRADSRLRACVQESLRLWPLVPALVRVTRAETTWRGVVHPAGTTVLVPAGFLQRDPAHVPAADLFVPGRWLTAGADHDTRTAPFSHGGGRCPGDQLGLLLTAAVCARVLRDHRVGGVRPALDPHRPLPGAVEATAIQLTLTPR
ncbi:cytochrome P450 [Streptomyces sp. WAC06614]|uniref:cytochrome P450 n=1 Tax=Streptomyces sp. WAC06614 TaxID=2487416 RepID=UPI000F77A0FC|nr:cytochrome P450 [Streptomyces sp. WAC06614]RSS79149.1 cytochrome P450 [Streptomyces sp. WAC06614]